MAVKPCVPSLESERDLADGQYVIVTARWILVTAGLLLALWLPGSLAELRLRILGIEEARHRLRALTTIEHGA